MAKIVSSPKVVRLWLLLRDRPGDYKKEDLMRELSCSKSKLEGYLQEIEEAGAIRLEVQE